jgi:hypothetical protein
MFCGVLEARKTTHCPTKDKYLTSRAMPATAAYFALMMYLCYQTRCTMIAVIMPINDCNGATALITQVERN